MSLDFKLSNQTIHQLENLSRQGISYNGLMPLNISWEDCQAILQLHREYVPGLIPKLWEEIRELEYRIEELEQ